MAHTYKLLILDYGGVYSFDYVASNFNKIMKSTFGKIPDDEQRQQIAEKSRLLGENKIGSQDYVNMVSNILGIPNPASVRQFEDATIAVTNPPSKEMVDLVARVRAAGIKVSLLSDMYMFELQLTRPWERYEGFDYTAFSAEAGITKQSPQFFEQTLRHFHVEAADALFVDDTMKNIEIAKSIGLGTLFADKDDYTQVGQLVNQIYSLLAIHSPK